MEHILLYRTKLWNTNCLVGYALRLHHILSVCLSKGKYIFNGIQDVGIVQDHNLPIVSSQYQYGMLDTYKAFKVFQQTWLIVACITLEFME